MFAAREGHVEIVRFLLDHAADPNATDSRGYTVSTCLSYGQSKYHETNGKRIYLFILKIFILKDIYYKNKYIVNVIHHLK